MEWFDVEWLYDGRWRIGAEMLARAEAERRKSTWEQEGYQCRLIQRTLLSVVLV